MEDWELVSEWRQAVFNLNETMADPRPPFDNTAADTVIRSRDGVNFRVRSGILAEASPVFSDMFTVPLPDPSIHADSSDYLDGKPVVAVEENSETLDNLLRLCYPVADPKFTELRDVRLVLAAALKYDMEEAIVLMKKALATFLDAQPLAVWASACALRLHDEAISAARSLLDKDLPEDAPPELELVTAGMYFRLQKFHRARGDVREHFSFIQPDPEDVLPSKNAYERAETAIVYQPRPFSDLICRSPDKEEYRTHKIVLGAASPVLLEKILALPSGPLATPPILDLDVPGKLLGAIIELCYPVRHDAVLNISAYDALAMADVAKRLQMDALYKILRFEAIGTTKVRRPLATYLLACRYGLSGIARDAQGFLHNDVLAYGCIPEMEVTPALPYHRLLVNRRKTLVMASTMTQSSTQAAPTSQQSATRSSESASQSTGDPWLLGLFDRTVEALRSPEQDEHWWEKPNTSKTLEESVQRKLWCSDCENKVRLLLRIEQVHATVWKAMNENNVGHSILPPPAHHCDIL